jgi:hypothetical protein
MRERDRRRWESIRADQAIIDEAAAWLRTHAIQSQYAGLQRQEVAFSLAAVLDVVSRHLPDVGEGVRWQTVQASRAVLGPP